MRVKELMEELKYCPGNKRILMACDEEGNTFMNVSATVEEGETEDGEPVVLLYPSYPEEFLF
jgi:hypothetical protein